MTWTDTHTHTHTQTDMLITILCSHIGGRVTTLNWINSEINSTSTYRLTPVSSWLRWPRAVWRSHKTSMQTWGCTVPVVDSSAAVAASLPPRSCQSRRCSALLGTVSRRMSGSPTCTPLHKHANNNILQHLLLLLLHTHTHPFNGPFPGLPRWAGTRKVKPIWILLKQETASGNGINWAICKSAPRSRQITTPTPHHSVFKGQMPFLPPNQQRQSTEGTQHLLLLHPFNGLFSRTTWVSWYQKYQKGKTSLDLNEARDDGVWGCSGISWTICKQSAPHSREITNHTKTP